MQLGAALVLGGMLVAAGVPKAAVPWYVASALRRVVRTGSDRALLLAGRLLGCWEVALGLALPLVYSGPAAVAVAACAVLTFAAFTGFVAAAIRRGAACGCWASLSEGPAGGAELARAAFLAVLAVALLAARLSWHGTGWPTPNPPAPNLPASNLPVPNLPAPNLPAPKADTWPAQGWALPGWPAPSGATLVSAAALLAVLWLATRLGAAVLPVHTATLRRRLRAQSAPGRAGQLAGQLALLAGFVSAGTRAGRRRYRAARATAGQAAPAGPSSIRRATSTLPPRPALAAPAVPAQVVPALAVPAPVVPALAAMASTAGNSR